MQFLVYFLCFTLVTPALQGAVTACAAATGKSRQSIIALTAGLPKGIAHHLSLYTNAQYAKQTGVTSSNYNDRAQGILNIWSEVVDGGHRDNALNFVRPFRAHLKKIQAQSALDILAPIDFSVEQFRAHQAKLAAQVDTASPSESDLAARFIQHGNAMAQANRTLRSDPTAGIYDHDQDFVATDERRTAGTATATMATTVGLPSVTHQRPNSGNIHELLEQLKKLCAPPRANRIYDISAIKTMYQQTFADSDYRVVALKIIADEFFRNNIALVGLIDLYNGNSSYEDDIRWHYENHSDSLPIVLPQPRDDGQGLRLQERVLLGLSVQYPTPSDETIKKCLAMLADHVTHYRDTETFVKTFNATFIQMPHRLQALTTIYQACGNDWRKLRFLRERFRLFEGTTYEQPITEWVYEAERAAKTGVAIPAKPTLEPAQMLPTPAAPAVVSAAAAAPIIVTPAPADPTPAALVATASAPSPVLPAAASATIPAPPTPSVEQPTMRVGALEIVKSAAATAAVAAANTVSLANSVLPAHHPNHQSSVEIVAKLAKKAVENEHNNSPTITNASFGLWNTPIKRILLAGTVIAAGVYAQRDRIHWQDLRKRLERLFA